MAKLPPNIGTALVDDLNIKSPENGKGTLRKGTFCPPKTKTFSNYFRLVFNGEFFLPAYHLARGH